MKKSFMIAAMSCLLVAGTVVGCGNKEAAEPARTEAATTQAVTEAVTEAPAAKEETTTAAETKAEEKAEAKAEAGSYTSWTGKEWSAASDEDKLAATKYYLIETTKATAKAMGQEYTSEMEAAYTDDVVKATIPTLDAAFAADASMSLQDILDMTTEAADAAAAMAAEYAAPQAQ